MQPGVLQIKFLDINFSIRWGSSYQPLCLQLQGRKLIIRGKMKLGEFSNQLTIITIARCTTMVCYTENQLHITPDKGTQSRTVKD